MLSSASSAKEAARQLETSESTVYKWAAGDLGREAARVAADVLERRAYRLRRRWPQLDAPAVTRTLKSLALRPWILRYKGQLHE